MIEEMAADIASGHNIIATVYVDCRSMYRWLIADAVPFARSLRFTLEHGDRNRVAGTYSTTALWYGP